MDADALQGLEDLGCRPGCGSDAEQSAVGVVVDERPAIGSGQLDRVGDDELEHLVRIEARAHRVADLREGLELLHSASQLGGPRRQGSEQLDVADGQRPLRRERGEQRVRSLVEGRDRRAPHEQDADDLVADQHRSAHDRPVTPDALEVRQGVVRVGQDVVDLLGHPVDADTPDEGGSVTVHRPRGGQLEEVLRHASGPHELVATVALEVDLGRVGPAQGPGALHDGVEDDVRLGW